MEGQLETLWNAIRDELRQEVPDFKFHIWLEPLAAAGLAGGTLYVRAPEHIRTSVAERYLPLLRSAAERSAGTRLAVEVVGDGWEPPASGEGASAGLSTGVSTEISSGDLVPWLARGLPALTAAPFF